jgi:hypothetical protein
MAMRALEKRACKTDEKDVGQNGASHAGPEGGR